MKNSKIFTLIALPLLLVGMLTPVKALAQEKIQIVVGPVRQELFLDPGETDNVEIRFYNQSEQPIVGSINVVDFVVNDSDGGPKLIDDPAAASPKFSGAKWVSLPYSQITIAPTNRVSVPVTISIPTNAAPGGRYVAVYFQPSGSGPTKTSGTGVSSRVASLLYIRINGEITENALITRFFAPNFFEYGPVSVSTEILNRGDYHIRPKAIVALTNVFGGLVDQVMLKEENIFPDTSRILETKVGPKWLFGRYKLSLMGSYGSSGKALEAVAYVWVMPWRVIAIVTLTLILAFILIKKLLQGSREQVEHLETKLEKEEAEIEELKKMLRKKTD